MQATTETDPVLRWASGRAAINRANSKHSTKAHHATVTYHESVMCSGRQSGKLEVMDGIVSKPSSHSVDETVDRLKNILQAKGITLFALIDHSGEAEKVGMKMPPTKLLIFGNPKGGTPLMLAAPSTAIDLPLKILVWEDGERKVWLSYNSPEYLQKRHGFPEELEKNIAVVEALVEGAGNIP